MDQIPDSKPLTSRAAGQALGISHTAVLKAIRSGRLRRSVRDGQVFDVDLARQELAENSDYTDAPQRVAALAPAETDGPEGTGPGGKPTLADAALTEKFWKAKHAELKFKQEARELVPAAEVEDKVAGKIIACRSRLLGIPSRARQALPQLTVADLAVLEEIVREALEELAA